MSEGNKEYFEKEFNNAINFFTEGIKVNCKDEEFKRQTVQQQSDSAFLLG